MPEPKLTYGLDPLTKRLIHIKDAKNGLACGCVCPECGDKLEAVNNGQKRTHHFRHSNGADCPYARMTALHMLAQQVLMEEKCVKLPAYKAQYYQHLAEKKYFDTVELETRFQTSNYLLRPDCIGYYEECSIWVEIFVTHLVNEEKRKLIIENDITCVEFDFSDLKDTDYTVNDIKKRLLDENYCQWVNAPDYDKQNSQCEEDFLRQQSEYYQQEHKDRQYIESVITKWKEKEDIDASNKILDILVSPDKFPAIYKDYLLREITPYGTFLKVAPKNRYSVRILRLLLQNVLPTDDDIANSTLILGNNKNLGNNVSEKQQITSLLALIIRIVGCNKNCHQTELFLHDEKIWKPIIKLAAIAATVCIDASKTSIDYAREIEKLYPAFAFACAMLLKQQPNMTVDDISYANDLEQISPEDRIDDVIRILLSPFAQIPPRDYKQELEMARERDSYFKSLEDDSITRKVQELNQKLAQI